MWLGNENALCVRFLFVQPGVVSTCSVTERISFVNSFAAVFRKGVLEFVWNFYLVGPFLRHVSKGMWNGDWTEFGVPFSRELHACVFSTLTVFLILHISDKRWISGLVAHCGSEASLFPCTARLN